MANKRLCTRVTEQHVVYKQKPTEETVDRLALAALNENHIVQTADFQGITV